MTIRKLSESLSGSLDMGRAFVAVCSLALGLALPGLPAAGQAGPPPRMPQPRLHRIHLDIR